jgi:replicative DNA helicase
MAAEVARLQVQPHSIEAEQALLGALMLDSGTWFRIASAVRPDDFFRPDHRLIFRCIAALAGSGDPVDPVTVSASLERVSRLSDAGGLAYLSRLARETPSSETAPAYAAAIRDRSAMRALGAFAEETLRSVADSHGRCADELIAGAMHRLLTLQDASRPGKGLVASRDLARELIDDLDRRRERRMGLEIGLSDFDALTCGIEPGDLVVIAGRPGMGKTSLLVTVALNVSTHAPTAVFSAEMPAQQLMRRCVALRGSIPQERLRRAERLTEDDWARLMPAAAELGELKLFVDDTALPPLAHIRAEAYALKARDGLGLILVDYVQLVQGAGGNRYEQLRDVAYGLKALAKDLVVPVIVLAQLNRGVEARDAKRPYMSDLRDSGAIEEAADIIGLLYSEGYYNRSFDAPYVLECQVEKNRNGERGECLWRFAGERSHVTVLDEGARIHYRRLLATQRGGSSSDL